MSKEKTKIWVHPSKREKTADEKKSPKLNKAETVAADNQEDELENNPETDFSDMTEDELVVHFGGPEGVLRKADELEISYRSNTKLSTIIKKIKDATVPTAN